jgi:serine/threonine protein kinase
MFLSGILRMVALYPVEVEDSLSWSQFGEPLLCRHKASGVLYVLKKIRKSRSGDFGAIELSESWESEVANMKAVTSPNVVELYGTITDRLYVYLVMEYCKKGNLRTLMKQRNEENKPFTTEVCLRFSGVLNDELLLLPLGNLEIYRRNGIRPPGHSCLKHRTPGCETGKRVCEKRWSFENRCGIDILSFAEVLFL